MGELKHGEISKREGSNSRSRKKSPKYERKEMKTEKRFESTEEPPGRKVTSSSVNWVASVDWSNQVAPDSTTNCDETIKKDVIEENNNKNNIIDAGSDCSSGSRDKEDASWKRKRRNKGNEEEF